MFSLHGVYSSSPRGVINASSPLCLLPLPPLPRPLPPPPSSSPWPPLPNLWPPLPNLWPPLPNLWPLTCPPLPSSLLPLPPCRPTEEHGQQQTREGGAGGRRGRPCHGAACAGFGSVCCMPGLPLFTTSCLRPYLVCACIKQGLILHRCACCMLHRCACCFKLCATYCVPPVCHLLWLTWLWLTWLCVTYCVPPGCVPSGCLWCIVLTCCCLWLSLLLGCS